VKPLSVSTSDLQHVRSDLVAQAQENRADAPYAFVALSEAVGAIDVALQAIRLAEFEREMAEKAQKRKAQFCRTA
jgi:hypothetical protein